MIENTTRPVPLQSSPLEIKGKHVVRNSFLNLVGLGVPLIIGFATVPFIIRWLGNERFGILSLVWVVFGYFGVFDFGLSTASTKFVAEALGRGELEKVPKFLWTAVFFQSFLGTAAAVLLASLTPWLVGRVLNIPPLLVGESRSAFYLLALSLPVVFASSSFRGTLEAGQRFDLVNAVKVPSSAANYVLPLVGVLVGFDLVGIVALFILARMLTLVVWILLCFRIFPVLKKKFSFYRETVRPLFSFGGWVTITNTFWPMFSYLDRFLIGSLLTVEAVSFYSAPYEGIMRLGIIPGSLMSTLFPVFSTLNGKNEKAKSTVFFLRSVRFVLLVLGPLVGLIIFFARDILRLWLGSEFAQASGGVLQILALAFFMSSLASAPFVLLQGAGRADITAKSYAFEFLIYAPLCWVLIKEWGIKGAAAALVARGTLDFTLLFGSAMRIEKIRRPDLAQAGIFRVLIVLLGSGILGTVISGSGWRVAGMIGLMPAFGLVCWRFILSREERLWVTSRVPLLFSRRTPVL